MKTKKISHTPGPLPFLVPWETFCGIFCGGLNRIEEDSRRMAILYASAPELLEAIKNLVAVWDKRYLNDADKNKLLSVIAKAEGREGYK